MKQNYQLLTDRETAALESRRPRLLLQSCCGPCSSYVLEYLCRFFEVTVLFYNPNIQPREEYEKRLYWQKQLLISLPEAAGAQLMDCPWDEDAFISAARGLEAEPEGGSRCSACFALRLEETAKRAREQGFEYFCTTLTVSPHKDAGRINAIGAALGEKYGVKWLPSDFKKREGYKRSIELSARYGLYRQDYCGCLFSSRQVDTAKEEEI